MHEDDPHAGPKKGSFKKNPKHKPKGNPVPVKNPLTSRRVQSQSYLNYTTPPRPTDPSKAGGKNHNQGDWNVSSRAKADAIFASTSLHWYAGAAFDRSPAAHTLPHPTKLLATRKSPTEMETTNKDDNIITRIMATSCPSSGPNSGSAPLTGEGGSKTRVASPEQRSRADLRAKSQDLLRMLKGGEAEIMRREEAKSPSVLPRAREVSGLQGDNVGTENVASDRDVNELTRQVRRLLNLPSPSGRQAT